MTSVGTSTNYICTSALFKGDLSGSQYIVDYTKEILNSTQNIANYTQCIVYSAGYSELYSLSQSCYVYSEQRPISRQFYSVCELFICCEFDS